MKTRMVTALSLIFLIFHPVFADLARASSKEGHGGVAYVCRDPATKQIVSARLLDLWEPEALTFPASAGSVDVQILAALERLRPIDGYAAKLMTDALARVRASIVNTVKAIPLSNDAFPQYVTEQENSNCKPEQVALYGWINELQVEGLRIYGEIYNSPLFSDQDRAALLIHEAGYLVDREDWGATNSLRTRAIVASVFAIQSPPLAVRAAILDWASGKQRVAPVDGTSPVEIRFRGLLKQGKPCTYRALLNERVIKTGEFDRNIGFFARLDNDFRDGIVLLSPSEYENGVFEMEMTCPKKGSLDRKIPVDLGLYQHGKELLSQYVSSDGTNLKNRYQIKLNDPNLVRP